VSATVYALKIPFLAAVRHSLAGRTWSDAVVVRVLDSDGVEGFGEAAPRPYVTGETPADVVAHVAGPLWPAIRAGGADPRSPATSRRRDPCRTAGPGAITPRARR
jgi:L-alanine-DL-glutamate epimerase-like enolase superfamily enzyme